MARIWILLVIASGLALLPGCGKSESAEKSRQAASEAASKTGEAVREGAKAAGDSIKDAGKKTGEAVQKEAANLSEPKKEQTPAPASATDALAAAKQTMESYLGSLDKGTHLPQGVKTPLDAPPPSA